MNFIADCFGLLVVVYYISIPFIWAWVFYHKIKCRKKEECSNRECNYWQYCEHNYAERKKDELELRKQMLLYSLRFTECEKTMEYGGLVRRRRVFWETSILPDSYVFNGHI